MEAISYHDELSSYWNKKYSNESFEARIERFKDLTEFIDLSPNRIIYDIGCGSGFLLKEGYYSPQHKYVCFDGSSKMLAEAVLNFEGLENVFFSEVIIDSNTDWDYIVNQNLGYPDVIVASSLVEYLDDHEQFINSMLEILKVGGLLVFTIPNADSRLRRMQKVVRNVSKIFGINVFSYMEVSKCDLSENELQRLLKKHQNIRANYYLPKSVIKVFGLKFKVSSLFYVKIRKM